MYACTSVFHLCVKVPMKSMSWLRKVYRYDVIRHICMLQSSEQNIFRSSLNSSFLAVIFAMVPKDTARKNGVKIDILSHGFSILHQGVCGSWQITISDICWFAYSKPISSSISKHSFQMVLSFSGRILMYKTWG